MPLADHPDVPFTLARNFTPGRPDGRVLWWILHEWISTEMTTTEWGSGSAGSAGAAGSAGPAGSGPAGSAQACESISSIEPACADESSWSTASVHAAGCARSAESARPAESARSVADYFSTAAAHDASAHYCFDEQSAVQCVRLRDCARVVGNRPGDRRGISALLVGFGYYQSQAEWLDEPGRRTLARVARIAARDLQRYRIPARWCTLSDLTAFRPGLTTRHDLCRAFGPDDVIADPEPSFPREHLLTQIVAQSPAYVPALIPGNPAPLVPDNPALIADGVADIIAADIVGGLAGNLPGDRAGNLPGDLAGGPADAAGPASDLKDGRPGDLAKNGTRPRART